MLKSLDFFKNLSGGPAAPAPQLQDEPPLDAPALETGAAVEPPPYPPAEEPPLETGADPGAESP